ncbi:hypothetical protein BV394_11915 [Brevirhabdus pacifica]|uniref:histidine kinase n=2 Tax=Brevirhabdus pacifica TaxID=1267768 RepID=A0A1U7DK05_9RHOB|nr:response regulator [Brevirhabdus pacifica]APX90347.1 hypothetical protein BV394_11915 [Brevirhabdus pacifica]OWU78618.1 hypothetical protein ATO5_07540 [Loktanella sp. 22II-4b]
MTDELQTRDVNVHDLNNMLAAIMISATIVERESEAPGMAHRHAGHILDMTRNAVRLINGADDPRRARASEGAGATAPPANCGEVAPEVHGAAPRMVRSAATGAAQGPARGMGRALAARPPLPRANRLDGVNLLLVEDDATLAGVLENWLALCGAQVTVAGDIATARGHLEGNTPPEIVLCDHFLPDGTGPDLARTLDGPLDGRPDAQPARIMGRRSARALAARPAFCLMSGAVGGAGTLDMRGGTALIDASFAKPLRLGALAAELARLARMVRQERTMACA